MLTGFFAALLRAACLILGVSGTGHFPPPLSTAEEREYFKRAAAGDEEARSKLIEHNLRLVAHVVRKYYSSYGNADDLVSIGSIGLIKAIDSFDADCGVRFATYAAKCIQNEILMYFRAQRKNGMEISFDEPIDVDRDGNTLSYGDIIYCDDTIADDLDVKVRLRRALDCIRYDLDERERAIMIMRYGLGTGEAVTQRETAKNMGISRSYVSRIEKSALEKIRKSIGE